jgi:putative ATPase
MRPMDLFSHAQQAEIARQAPLAARMRPRTLAEFIGQEHILGPGKLLRRAVEADQLASIVLWGPPGTGKTTLASIIALTTHAEFTSLSAVMAGVKDLREAVERAKQTRSLYSRRTVLFVDEIHRFNKSQQDALLPYVEDGTLILIGATTENPYFEVIGALVSRSRVFQLLPLDRDSLEVILRIAATDPERGYGGLLLHIADAAFDHWAELAGGDARVALNALELAVQTTPADAGGVIRVGLDIAQESIQRRALLYDKNGDAHYDTISAFIKSVRGSDPDAAVYWLAKMLYAGEDPEFIARRMLILASEDIGLADPQALIVATAAAQALEWVGLPEARYALSEAALYLATAPKSNSAGALFKALADVEAEGEVAVPKHLQDANRDAKGLGHGQGYKYPHDYPDHHVPQQYLPWALRGRVYYHPSEQGYERAIAGRLRLLRQQTQDDGKSVRPPS